MKKANNGFSADADNPHLAYAKDAYPKMHELICTLIQRSALETLLDEESWKKDSQVLGIKLAQHLHTLNSVAQVTTLNHPQLDIRFVDFSSVNTLVRAVIETFIVYAYIYKCEDRDLSIFRHNTWELAGLSDRQGMKPVVQEHHEQLNREKQRIDELTAAIRTSRHVGKNEKRLLRGDWRAGKSWTALGVEAGLHPRWLEHIYNHLSGHAHTSYLSVLQLGQAPLADQRWMADICLSIGLEIMAHFAAIFARNRRAAARYLAENEDGQQLVKFWQLTFDDYEKVYAPPGFHPPIWRLGDAIYTPQKWHTRVTTDTQGTILHWTQ